MRALVVGGGPTGLLTASELARRGHDVTVVEASTRWGGMAASVDIDGIRCDLGSHRLHPAAGDRVEELIVELLGADLQVRQRNGRILLDGNWVRFPLHPVDLARRLPPRFVARAVRDTVLKPVRPAASATFADVVRSGLGPAMLDWFYGPYARKLWGREAEELAGDLARRRIAANSPTRIISKLVSSARGKRPEFRYPRLGYGEVVDRLVERARRDGADLIAGCGVKSLAPDRAGVVVELSTGERERFDRVWWSASAGRLADAAASGGRDDVPLFRPSMRAVVCCYLGYDAASITSYDAHYLPQPELLAARVSEPKNYRDGDDPADRTVLCAEVVCDVGDERWTASPEDLGARVAAELVEIGLTDLLPTRYALERLPSVYPVVAAGEEEGIASLLGWARQLPNVTLFGRQGLVVADNLHHVFDMAFAAVDCVDDNGWDDTAWLAALARFDAHVVED